MATFSTLNEKAGEKENARQNCQLQTLGKERDRETERENETILPTTIAHIRLLYPQKCVYIYATNCVISVVQ